MGMKLTPAMRKAIDAGGLPARRVPVPGFAMGFIAGDPPTVTHQDKRLAPRGSRMAMVDSPALTAARMTYLAKVPIRSGAAVAGPLLLTLQFRWSCAAVQVDTWRETPPDWDNAAKTFQDILCRQGWIANDAMVARAIVETLDVPLGDGGRPGIVVNLCTMAPYGLPTLNLPDATTFTPGLRFFPFNEPPTQGVAHAS